MSVCYLSCRSRAAEFTTVCDAFQSGFISLQASVLLRSLNLVRNSLYFIAASFIEVFSFILSYFLLFKNKSPKDLETFSFFLSFWIR